MSQEKAHWLTRSKASYLPALFLTLANCSSPPTSHSIEERAPVVQKIGLEDYSKNLPTGSKVLIGWNRWSDYLPGPEIYKNNLSGASRQVIGEELQKLDMQGDKDKAKSTRDVLKLTGYLDRTNLSYFVTPLVEDSPLPGFYVLDYKPTDLVTQVKLGPEQVRSLRDSFYKTGSEIKTVYYLNSGGLERLTEK